MKKEVLRLEYEKAFDTWYGRIAYQDENILKRDKIGDKELEVYSFTSPYFVSEVGALYLRGTRKELDLSDFRIGSDEDKRIVEEKVRKINEKYGVVRKSWKEMVDECEEVPFVKKGQNYYVFFNHKNNEVGKFVDQEVEDYKKYISREDAERIVRECKENNQEE